MTSKILSSLSVILIRKSGSVHSPKSFKATWIRSKPWLSITMLCSSFSVTMIPLCWEQIFIITHLWIPDIISSIAHWIKNLLQRTSEPDHKYNYLNFSFFYKRKFIFLPTLNLFLNENWVLSQLKNCRPPTQKWPDFMKGVEWKTKWHFLRLLFFRVIMKNSSKIGVIT